VFLQDLYQLVVRFRLNLVQDWNTSGPTVDAEGPSDLLRELSTIVPSATANLCLVDLHWAWKLQVWQYFSMHIMPVRSPEQFKMRLQGSAATAHVAGHLRSSVADPHSKRKVE